MKIAIIGTGNVGGALAGQWAKAGHDVYLGVRDTQRFKGKELLINSRISAHSLIDAITAAETILVATPPQVANSMIDEWGDQVADKIVIDATNAVRSKPDPYPTVYHAFTNRTAAQVVKCFNSTGFENMQDPDYGAVQLDMFMAGDSESAKEVAKNLALDAGFAECYDFGGSDRVELLEKLALSWINLAIFQGMGRDIGFKLVKRQ